MSNSIVHQVNGNIYLGSGTSPNFNNGVNVMYLDNPILPSAPPSTGVFIYSNSDKLEIQSNNGTKTIVDSSGITVTAKTVGILTGFTDSDGTYINGSGTMPSVDTISLSIGDSILVDSTATLTDPAHRGIYIVTTVGGPTWQLIRADYANSAETLKKGVLITIAQGFTMGGTVWIHDTLSQFSTPIIFNTTALTFSQVNGGGGGGGTGSFTFGTGTIASSVGADIITSSNANIVLSPNGTGITTSSRPLSITNATASTTSSTGAVIVTGGIGVGANSYFGGQLHITDTTAGGISTGSLVSAGGVSIAGDVYLGGDIIGIATDTDIGILPNGTGRLALNGLPTADNHAATKLYVDGLVNGLLPKQASRVKTTTNDLTVVFAGTYSAVGVGAGKYLEADTNGVIPTVDGVTLAVNDRVLWADSGTAQVDYGIYTVTSIGSVSTQWRLTRSTDADNSPSGEVVAGIYTFITTGTVHGNQTWTLLNTPITLDVTPLTWTQSSGGISLTPSFTNVTTSNITIAIPDTQTISTSSGDLMLASANNQDIKINPGGTGAVRIGDTSTGIINVGSSSSSTTTITGTTTAINSTSGAVSIQPVAGQDVNVSTSTTGAINLLPANGAINLNPTGSGIVNVNTGASTGVTNISGTALSLTTRTGGNISLAPNTNGNVSITPTGTGVITMTGITNVNTTGTSATSIGNSSDILTLVGSAINATGVLTVNSSGSAGINIGTGTYSGTMSIGNASSTLSILGITNVNTSGSAGVNLGTGSYSGTVSVGNSASTLTIIGITNVNTSGSTAVNLGTGTYSGTMSVGNSSSTLEILGVANVNTSGSTGINLGTGTYSGTVSVGNASSTLTVLGITNVNTSGSTAVNLGTGAYSGTMSVGNSASTLEVLGATNVNTSGSTAVNFGTGTYSGSLTIGNVSGIPTVRILGTLLINATGSSNTNIGTALYTGTITIGNSSSSSILRGTTIALTAATTINSTGSLSTDIGTGTNTGTVTIGNTGITGVSIVGPTTINTTSSNTTSIGNAGANTTITGLGTIISGIVGINTTNASTVNIATAASGTGLNSINIGNSTGPSTTVILGTQHLRGGAVSINTSGTAFTTTIGQSLSTFDVNAGAQNYLGVININTSNSFATNIGTNTYSGTVTIGNDSTTNTILRGALVSINATSGALTTTIGNSAATNNIFGTTSFDGDVSINFSNAASTVIGNTSNSASMRGTTVTINNGFVGANNISIGAVGTSIVAINGTITLNQSGTGATNVGSANTGNVNVGNSTGTTTITGSTTSLSSANGTLTLSSTSGDITLNTANTSGTSIGNDTGTLTLRGIASLNTTASATNTTSIGNSLANVTITGDTTNISGETLSLSSNTTNVSVTGATSLSLTSTTAGLTVTGGTSLSLTSNSTGVSVTAATTLTMVSGGTTSINTTNTSNTSIGNITGILSLKGVIPTVTNNQILTYDTSTNAIGTITSGTNGQVLTSNGSTVSWQTPSTPATQWLYGTISGRPTVYPNTSIVTTDASLVFTDNPASTSVTGSGKKFVYDTQRNSLIASFATGTQFDNIASHSVIFGVNNTSEYGLSSILGGQDNTVTSGSASNTYGVIVGGTTNTINSANSKNAILMGNLNQITGTSDRNSILAGSSNTITGSADCVIAGGESNTITTGSTSCFIGSAGNGSSITNAMNSVLLGGITSTINDQNPGAYSYGFVGCGSTLRLRDAGYSGVVSGITNWINGGLTYIASFIGSGQGNFVNSSSYAAVVGGFLNGVSADYGVVCGGRSNRAQGQFSFVGGGGDTNGANGNIASGIAASVLGGRSNTASGDFSVALGQGATASHANSFVFADGTALTSSAVSEFSVSAAGGIRLNTVSGNVLLGTGTGSVTIGNTSNTLSLTGTTVSINTTSGITNVGTGTGNVSVGNTTGTMTISGSSSSITSTGTTSIVGVPVNINSVSGTTNVGTGTGITNIGTGFGTVNIGNTNSNTNISGFRVDIQQPVRINTTSANTTSIGNGGTGAVNIGNSTGSTTITGNATSLSGISLSLSTAAGSIDITSSTGSPVTINTAASASTANTTIGNSTGTLSLVGVFATPTANNILVQNSTTKVVGTLTIGTNGQVLTSNGTTFSWASPAPGVTSLDGLTDAYVSGTIISLGNTATPSSATRSTIVSAGYTGSLTGTDTVIIGGTSGGAITSAQFNTIVGASSGNLITGASNTIFGAGTGSTLTTGATNTIIGRSAGSTTLSTGSSNILIGNAADVNTAGSTSNAIVIGNNSTGNGNAIVLGNNITATPSSTGLFVPSTLSTLSTGNILGFSSTGQVGPFATTGQISSLSSLDILPFSGFRFDFSDFKKSKQVVSYSIQKSKLSIIGDQINTHYVAKLDNFGPRTRTDHVLTFANIEKSTPGYTVMAGSNSAFASGSVIGYSHNGEQFIGLGSRFSASVLNTFDIAYNGTMWMAIYQAAHGIAIGKTPLDLSVVRPYITTPFTDYPTCICVVKNRWYVGGSASSAPVLAWSIDGLMWNSVTIPGTFGNVRHVYGLYYTGADLFMATDHTVNGLRISFLRDPYMDTFDTASVMSTAVGGTTSTSADARVYMAWNGKLLSVGWQNNASSACMGYIYPPTARASAPIYSTTTDGVTLGASSSHVRSLKWTGKYFVIALYTDSTTVRVYRSDNGFKWAEILPDTSVNTTISDIFSLAWTGNKVIIGGHRATGYSINIAGYNSYASDYTTDVNTLSNICTIADNNTKQHKIVFPKERIWAGGNSAITTNRFAYSEDGGINFYGFGGVAYGINGYDALFFKGTWVFAWTNGTAPITYLPELYETMQPVYIPFMTSGTKFASNGNIIVATGTGATASIVYSYDCIHWLPCAGTFAICTTFFDVVYTGTQFIAVGSTTGSNAWAYSTDGITWTAGGGSGIFSSYINIATTNGSIVLVGGIGTSVMGIITNTTPPVLSALPITKSFFTSSVQGLAWNGSRWGATGQDGAVYKIGFSDDGYNWKFSTITPFNNGIGRIFWASDKWIFGGFNTGAARGVYYTINEQDIVQSPVSFVGSAVNSGFGWFGSSNPQNAYVVITQKYLMLGNGPLSMATSDDGVSYKLVPKNDLFTTSGNCGKWNGNLYALGGAGTNTLAYTYDLKTFTGVGTTIFSTSCNGIAYSTSLSLFVAVGEGTNTIATSPDGITWTGRGSTIFTTRGNAVIYENGWFVAAGEGTNAYAWSSDGISWTGGGTSLLTSGYCVTWGYGGVSSPTNSYYFMVGGAGSTNNIVYAPSSFSATAPSSWTGVAVATAFGASGACKALAHNGRTFLATGFRSGFLPAQFIYTTSAPATWSSHFPINYEGDASYTPFVSALTTPMGLYADTEKIIFATQGGTASTRQIPSSSTPSTLWGIHRNDDYKPYPSARVVQETAFASVSGAGSGTLTNTGTLAALTVDTVTLSVGDILLYAPLTTSDTGLYQVTTVGSGVEAWVITRLTGYSYANSTTNYVRGMMVAVKEGSAHANSAWVLHTAPNNSYGQTYNASATNLEFRKLQPNAITHPRAIIGNNKLGSQYIPSKIMMNQEDKLTITTPDFVDKSINNAALSITFKDLN